MIHDSSNIQMRNELSQDSTTRFLTRIVDRVNGPLATTEPFDYRLHEKIKRFLKPCEATVQELIARTGISPQSLRDWSNEKITVFILQSEMNNEADGVKAPHGFLFK